MHANFTDGTTTTTTFLPPPPLPPSLPLRARPSSPSQGFGRVAAAGGPRLLGPRERDFLRGHFRLMPVVATFWVRNTTGTMVPSLPTRSGSGVRFDGGGGVLRVMSPTSRLQMPFCQSCISSLELRFSKSFAATALTALPVDQRCSVSSGFLGAG